MRSVSASGSCRERQAASAPFPLHAFKSLKYSIRLTLRGSCRGSRCRLKLEAGRGIQPSIFLRVVFVFSNQGHERYPTVVVLQFHRSSRIPSHHPIYTLHRIRRPRRSITPNILSIRGGKANPMTPSLELRPEQFGSHHTPCPGGNGRHGDTDLDRQYI
ncbi:uncharacterized protein BJX67DRAFT_28525 [Aspergillus lucknowensis]|uniref:Uncharacterized protein n=1 Tax=Aspergillus lucknowensis TaxID=176173 RepID=A0ABR4LXW3_9EURO